MTKTREPLTHATLDAFPLITQQETMTEGEYTAAYGRFTNEYFETILATPASTAALRLHRIVTGPISSGRQQATITFDQYHNGIRAIGAASVLILHSEARSANRPTITASALADFVLKYGYDRTFVKLDQYGKKYAIVA